VTSKKRTRVPRPYPLTTLEEALGIAIAIYEKNSGLQFDRVLLAKSLGTTPASSGFTTRLSSSTKYGLTEGGYADERIALTARGRSAVGAGNERRRALLGAALEPELFQRFYSLLDGKRLPEDAYAKEVLRGDLELQEGLEDECFRIIKANGLYVGILGDVGGSLYVSLAGVHQESEQASPSPEPVVKIPPEPVQPFQAKDSPQPGAARSGRVFIGHAGNPDIADYLKSVLDPFGILYLIVESDFDSNRPLAQDVSEQMRDCDAAILVFASTSQPEWTGRREQKRHEKMLYQLGAASALYGDRVLALRERSADESPQDGGFHTLVFHRDSLQKVGLAVLSELHRRGIIEVRTAGRATES